MRSAEKRNLRVLKRFLTAAIALRVSENVNVKAQQNFKYTVEKLRRKNEKPDDAICRSADRNKGEFLRQRDLSEFISEAT